MDIRGVPAGRVQKGFHVVLDALCGGLAPRIISVLLVVIVAGRVAGANSQARDEEHYQAACAALNKGRHETALREVRLALQNNPLHANSHYLLGCLLVEEGELDQAIVGFQRALTLRPDDPEILYNMGSALLKRGEAVSAAQILEQTVMLSPDHVKGYNNLGKAYYQTGLPDLAAAAYREALRRDPDNAISRDNLDLIVAQSPPDHLKEQQEVFESASEVPSDHLTEQKEMLEAASEDPSASEEPKGDVPPKAPPEAEPAAIMKDLQAVLRDLPNVTVEQRGSKIVVSGYTSGTVEREMLTLVLGNWPEVLDLTTPDVGDLNRMIEVDATLFMVLQLDSQSVGFNFLRMINLSFDFFAADNRRDGIGFVAPETIGPVFDPPQHGWLFTAGVDYDVNIANAVDEEVALLARPHLTTLSGSPATFLAGGEIIFEVSGLNSGDIKPYPFGTTLTVTPTLLATRGEDDKPRVHLAAHAGRTSVLSVIAASEEDDKISFTKVQVQSEAVLDIGETLILSGLNQRETTTVKSGVPILRDIPILRLFFSDRTTIDSQISVIILLTPRDPAYVEAKNKLETRKFVQKRRAFIEALQGTDDDMVRFRQDYPDWDRIAPNRLASHIFLSQNSEVYQSFIGQDLTSEDLEFNLLAPKLEKR